MAHRQSRRTRLVRERLGQGPAVVRDYVKSMKHHWHEAAYIPDVADRTLRPPSVHSA
jgi:hypothetical protein